MDAPHLDFHFALIAACPSERQLAWSTSPRDAATACALLEEHIRGTQRNVESAPRSAGMDCPDGIWAGARQASERQRSDLAQYCSVR